MRRTLTTLGTLKVSPASRLSRCLLLVASQARSATAGYQRDSNAVNLAAGTGTGCRFAIASVH